MTRATDASSTTSIRLVQVRVRRRRCTDGVQRLDRQWVPLHDLEQAEGWKAAVLKLQEKLKNAGSALTAGRTSGVRQSHRVACVGCSNCAGTGSNQSRGTS